MASGYDNLERLLSCAVCYEEFEEDGNHLPRLLPCTHTVCEACIKQLIRYNRLECPECRAKHDAKNEEKSFPPNKYLLMQIKRSPNVRQGEEEVYEEIDRMFRLSFKTYQKRDSVADKRREVLMKKIVSLERKLQEKITALNTAQNKVNRRNENFLKDLENGRNKIKHELDKQFDKMKKEGEDQSKEANDSLKTEISALDENLNLLSSIKFNAEDDYLSKVADMIETVDELNQMVNQNYSGSKTYRCPEYTSTTARVSAAVGSIVKRQFTVKLPEIDEDDVLETPVRLIRDVSQLRCTSQYPRKILFFKSQNSSSCKTVVGTPGVKVHLFSFA